MSNTHTQEADEGWMRLALEEARQGLGKTTPNPPVGAIIVQGETQLSAGHHKKAGGPHAEIEALRAAPGANLAGSTMYVTLEPCSTFGKTPPCVAAILEAGIGRVVVGSTDPNPRHAGAGLVALERAGIAVTTGVLEAECDHLIRFFRKHVVTGTPYIIAKTGMTLDGRITGLAGASSWITGEVSRNDVQRLRAEVDAILVGGETVRQDNPRLTLRGALAGERDQPLRIVVTRSGDLPADALLFTDEHRERTRMFHVEHLGPVFATLGQEGVSSVLLECGGRLMGEAFAGRFVDEVVFYIAPTIGGGPRRSVEGEGFRVSLRDPEIAWFGADLRYRALVDYPQPE
jgi:diaminohydroxyphosphoribosylaminopyrimidine deaminase/5-amino-6-(5-phosphoribosylamino)uracil reductase